VIGSRTVVSVDHLVYATPDVATTIDSIERLFGVRPVAGGKHPAWGTHNALLALGKRSYLEIIGPHSEEPETKRPRPFGLDALEDPRLVTWVAPGEHLEAIVHRAMQLGIDLGSVQSRSRKREDGSILTWKMTDLSADREGGIVPYFIDWGDSPHPAESAPVGAALVNLQAEHPRAEHVRSVLAHLGLDLPVSQGPAPALVATIDTLRGRIQLC
jgi:hypothetical protein